MARWLRISGTSCRVILGWRQHLPVSNPKGASVSAGIPVCSNQINNLNSAAVAK